MTLLQLQPSCGLCFSQTEAPSLLPRRLNLPNRRCPPFSPFSPARPLKPLTCLVCPTPLQKKKGAPKKDAGLSRKPTLNDVVVTLVAIRGPSGQLSFAFSSPCHCSQCSCLQEGGASTADPPSHPFRRIPSAA